MPITTEALLIAARAAARPVLYRKDSIANVGASQIVSLYRATGFPTQPVVPAAHVVCDATTTGAITLPFVISGGNNVFVDAILMQFAVPGQLQMVDRIIHGGGLNGTLITAQTVSTPALPARAPAARCRWFLECYADLGATATNATLAVTHTDATTANIVVAIPTTWRAARQLEIIAGAGKVIASVQSVTLTATTGVAGSFGVTCELPVGVRCGVLAAGSSIEYESLMRDMQSASPCLVGKILATNTTAGAIDGEIIVMQG